MMLDGKRIKPEELKSMATDLLDDTTVGENIKEAQMTVDEEGYVTEADIINVRSLLNLAMRRYFFGETRKKCKSMLEFLAPFEPVIR